MGWLERWDRRNQVVLEQAAARDRDAVARRRTVQLPDGRRVEVVAASPEEPVGTRWTVVDVVDVSLLGVWAMLVGLVCLPVAAVWCFVRKQVIGRTPWRVGVVDPTVRHRGGVVLLERWGTEAEARRRLEELVVMLADGRQAVPTGGSRPQRPVSSDA